MNNICLEITNELAEIMKKVNERELDRMAEAITQANRVFCAGCGRSGFVIRGLAMRLMHFGLDSHYVGEPTQPSIRENDLLVIVSSSGETSSLVSMAKKAKGFGARLAVISASPTSTLRDMSDAFVYVPVLGFMEKNIQPNGNLTEQSSYIICDAIGTKVMKKVGATNETLAYNHTNLE